MITSLLLADLVTELPHPVRLQRLVNAIRTHFGCGAVGLLKIEGDGLRPLAVDGLVRETLGRRFVVAQHPRLSAILASRAPVRFPPGSALPDPYDGLLENHRDEPLPVHDCMGISLHIDGQPWGVLTLDAPDSGEGGGGEVFDAPARDALAELALLVEATVRMTRIEEENRALRAGRSADAGRSPAGAPAERSRLRPWASKTTKPSLLSYSCPGACARRRSTCRLAASSSAACRALRASPGSSGPSMPASRRALCARRASNSSSTSCRASR